jgi:hypothetical protein
MNETENIDNAIEEKMKEYPYEFPLWEIKEQCKKLKTSSKTINDVKEILERLKEKDKKLNFILHLRPSTWLGSAIYVVSILNNEEMASYYRTTQKLGINEDSLRRGSKIIINLLKLPRFNVSTCPYCKGKGKLKKVFFG